MPNSIKKTKNQRFTPSTWQSLVKGGLSIVVSLGFLGTVLAGETVRVNVSSGNTEANDWSHRHAVSANGRFVAFMSFASNLVPNDTNQQADIFVHDRQTGQTTRVSIDSGGNQANNGSIAPGLSESGRFVSFASSASNLVAGDTNGVTDIFWHDRQTGITKRVSVSSIGGQSNHWSLDAVISEDGNHIAFESDASNLVAGDTNNQKDVFVHDLQTSQTTRVSVDSLGNQADNWCFVCGISADGNRVAFNSKSGNLVPGDTNGNWDVFVHDRATGQTVRVNVDSQGSEVSGGEGWGISGDGQAVVFTSVSSQLVTGDSNGVKDVFVRDMASGITSRVSIDSDGSESNGRSRFASISSDGRVIAFTSDATNLVAGDSNGLTDVFMHDRLTGRTERVSVHSSGLEGNGASNEYVDVSGDGRVVTFESEASNLVPGDTLGLRDIFAHDRYVGSSYCFGDGTGTGCPCGNAGGAEEGCANSGGTGALLVATGSSSVATDDVSLTAEGLIPLQSVLLFSGRNAVNSGSGNLFGDGLRCAGGNVARLGVRPPDANGVARWGPDLGAAGGWAAGDTRHFQAWYRDPGGPCGAGFNLTNGIEVTFMP